MNITTKTLIAVFGATCFYVADAYSAVHITCARLNAGSSDNWAFWPQNPTITLDTATLDQQQRNVIFSAAGAFNAVRNSGRIINVTSANTGAFSSIGAAGGNNANNVWRDANPGAWGSTAVYLLSDCDGSGNGQIEEFDIRISDSANILSNADYDPANPQFYPLKLLAMHELGHGMGLDHAPSDLAVMNSQTMASGDFGRLMVESYHADDKEGFREIYAYAGGSSELNVAGSRYWVDQNDAPGLNEFNLMTSTNSFTSLAPTNITRGSWYRIPFHIENQSVNQNTSYQDVEITFYASTDSVITTTDDVLGTALYTIYDGAERRGSMLFQLPNSLNGGGQEYHFGFKLSKPYNSSPDLNQQDDEVVFRLTHNVF